MINSPGEANFLPISTIFYQQILRRSQKKAFGIPVDTVAEYTATLSEAFLVFEVERFHRNLKVQSRDPCKVYVVDAGLRRVAARSAEADIGRLLENLVYLDLRRRGKTAFYYQQNSAVDFIVTSNYSPESAIQVCAYGMDISETRTRKVSSLLSCLKDLELQEGTIITMDRNEIIEAEGKIIRSVAAADWLL